MPTFKLSDLTDKPELIYKLNQLDGGGVTTLGGLTDVNVNNVTGGQILKYNDSTGKWVNSNDTSINIAASPGDSIIRGSIAGSVTISGTTVRFIINPARPNVPTSPSIIENHQGVVRPLFEYNTIRMDNRYITNDIIGGVINQGSYSDSIYIATSMFVDKTPVVFVPITTIYYNNSQTKRYESIPCLAIPKSFYDNANLSYIYGDPVTLAPLP